MKKDIQGKLSIGKVGRSHGVKGFFLLHDVSGDGSHFNSLEKVWLDCGTNGDFIEKEIAEVKPFGNKLLLRFLDIGTPEAIVPFVGATLWVDRDQGASLAADEYYYADLLECHLVTEGKKVALVRDLHESRGRLYLDVKRDIAELKLLEVDVEQPNMKALIPFEEAFVGAVDLVAKTIELKNKWLLA